MASAGGRQGLPLLAVLLLATIPFGLFNDNHHIRLAGNAPPPPATICNHLRAWADSGMCTRVDGRELLLPVSWELSDLARSKMDGQLDHPCSSDPDQGFDNPAQKCQLFDALGIDLKECRVIRKEPAGR